MATKTITMTIDVTFDDTKTDADSLSSALDTAIDNTLSTTGLLDDYGQVSIGAFFPKADKKYKRVCVGCGKVFRLPIGIGIPVHNEKAVVTGIVVHCSGSGKL